MPASSGRGTARDRAGEAAVAADESLRVMVPAAWVERAGAVLMGLLGPFEVEDAARPCDTDEAEATLVFYPASTQAAAATAAAADLTDDEIRAALPAELVELGRVRLERRAVPRDWVDGWKQHFRPVVIGEVRIRPPWEPPAGAAGVAATAAAAGAGTDAAARGILPPAAETAAYVPPPTDVVINPGLGFGTGLHPTTRGVLRLLQGLGPEEVDGSGPGGSPSDGASCAPSAGPPLGRLVDVGTGSGILAITAAKLGWGPVFAYDNDPQAVKSARENVEANGVAGVVEVHRSDLTDASPFWSAGATVLANMTLEPVLALLRKITRDAPALQDLVTEAWPRRVVVSGILAGEQERELVTVTAEQGFIPGRCIHDGEWVSMELLPARAGRAEGRVESPAGSG